LQVGGQHMLIHNKAYMNPLTLFQALGSPFTN
jgi:hypothetical protein